MISRNQGSLTADLILLLVAGIWGFGFVAQRAGMEHVGPFTFNAVRFFLGGLCLLPLVRLESRRERHPLVKPWLAGLAAGCVLFGGAALQQVGMQYTTAGKAGFITGLYVVLVPLLALALGHRTPPATWCGALLSILGLYLLTARENFTMARGDLLVLIGALFWAAHVLLLSFLSPRTRPIRLAMDQFFCCGLLSLLVALCSERISLAALSAAAIPTLYSGIISVGMGYTLQVVAQQRANPSHAAILLSLESVFAVFAGWLLLDEQLTSRAALGCGLILAGMLCSQLFSGSSQMGS